MTEALPASVAQRRVPKFRRQAGRREQMIDAALELLFDKGYDGCRIEDVAKLAGVGKSAVLYHFGSKLGLVASVVAKHCLPQQPVGTGSAEAVIEASLAQPSASKALRFVMTEQRRLPSLGRLYVVAILRRVSGWQGFDNIDAVRAGVSSAFGRMAAHVLFEGYPIKEQGQDGSQPV